MLRKSDAAKLRVTKGRLHCLPPCLVVRTAGIPPGQAAM